MQFGSVTLWSAPQTPVNAGNWGGLEALGERYTEISGSDGSGAAQIEPFRSDLIWRKLVLGHV